jgi:aspartate racemase
MGPAAGAWFAYRLALLTDAACDQQHVPVLLMNDPRIPDRSEARIGSGASPLPDMQRRLQVLEANGCTCAVIPCNTAHYWHADLQASVQMPLLSIVDSVVGRLREVRDPGACVALLGTRATVRSDLYRKPLAEAGYAVLPLCEDDQKRFCERPIQAVKRNQIALGAEALADAIEALSSSGAGSYCFGVLSCRWQLLSCATRTSSWQSSIRSMSSLAPR